MLSEAHSLKGQTHSQTASSLLHSPNSGNARRRRYLVCDPGERSVPKWSLSKHPGPRSLNPLLRNRASRVRSQMPFRPYWTASERLRFHPKPRKSRPPTARHRSHFPPRGHTAVAKKLTLLRRPLLRELTATTEEVLPGTPSPTRVPPRRASPLLSEP